MASALSESNIAVSEQGVALGFGVAQPSPPRTSRSVAMQTSSHAPQLQRRLTGGGKRPGCDTDVSFAKMAAAVSGPSSEEWRRDALAGDGPLGCNATRRLCTPS